MEKKRGNCPACGKPKILKVKKTGEFNICNECFAIANGWRDEIFPFIKGIVLSIKNLFQLKTFGTKCLGEFTEEDEATLKGSGTWKADAKKVANRQMYLEDYIKKYGEEKKIHLLRKVLSEMELNETPFRIRMNYEPKGLPDGFIVPDLEDERIFVKSPDLDIARLVINGKVLQERLYESKNSQEAKKLYTMARKCNYKFLKEKFEDIFARAGELSCLRTVQRWGNLRPEQFQPSHGTSRMKLADAL